MKKRFFALLLSAVLAAALTVPAGAEQLPALQVNGEVLSYVPQLSRGRSYLPEEELSAALGAQSEREGDSVIFSREGKEIELEVAWEQDGQAWLPIRAASSALGYSVGWDREKRTVILVDLWALTGQTVGYWEAEEAKLGDVPAAAVSWAVQTMGTGAAGPLSAIPLTDAETAYPLLVQASQLWKGEGGSLILGETSLSVDVQGERTLTVHTSASGVLPAEKLGLEGEELTLTLRAQGEEWRALATIGRWQACARWGV